MSARPQKKPFAKIPLLVVLIVPFVVQVVLVVGLVGYLSFRNGQRAVNDVARQLRDEITARIAEHLRTFLETPHQINQINAAAMRQGWLDANDAHVLERHFWEQVQVFDSVTSIYFGNAAGGLVNSGREGVDGALYVIATDGFVHGPFRKYATDSQGKRTDLLAVVPDFDARTRPWYVGAVKKGDATWSDVYILFTGQDMAVAASRPVYDQQQNLLGVVSVDLFLSQLSDFMKTLDIGKTGQSFIIERSGLLIASSTDEKPFIVPDGGAAPRRLGAGESALSLIRGAAQTLIGRFGSYQAIAVEQQFEFEMNGQRQFIQVSPVRNGHGLDWLIVTVIPESDFMAQINANNRTTALLILAALAAAVASGMVTARWITRPVLRLRASAQTLAKGEWPQAVVEDSWISEVDELTRSFNQMAGQLKQVLESLTAEVAERKRTEASLRESEERLGLVLKAADLGTWDWSVQTGEVIFNERWAEMLGYTLDEVEPNVHSWERLMHSDEVPWVMAVLTAHLEGHTSIYQMEYRLHTRSGDWKWILDTGKVLVRDEQNRPLRAVGIHQDISERKHAEEALRESHRRLEKALLELKETQDKMVRQERLAAVGQLTAGIAHDFNNILTSMLGFAELLQASPDTPESVRADLANIIVPGQRAAHLIRQMLDFSRKSVRRLKRLDLVSLVQENVQSLGRVFPENIHIYLNIGPQDYMVEADPDQIQQMLTNLALNARDAMPGGGELGFHLSRAEFRGEVSCVDCNQVIEGDWIRLTVTDTGSGIAPDVLHHIFEPFFTTKEIGCGSGLGLAQVLGIVQQHAGHLAIDSQVGRGTTFAIYLHPLTVNKDETFPN